MKKRLLVDVVDDVDKVDASAGRQRVVGILVRGGSSWRVKRSLMMIRDRFSSLPLLALTLTCVLAFSGCGGCGSKPAPAQPPQAAASPGQMVTANVITVDLDGRPLSGMMPIASTYPNAFDAPVARGQATKDDG